jgi:hypothetical protein
LLGFRITTTDAILSMMSCGGKQFIELLIDAIGVYGCGSLVGPFCLAGERGTGNGERDLVSMQRPRRLAQNASSS